MFAINLQLVVFLDHRLGLPLSNSVIEEHGHAFMAFWRQFADHHCSLSSQFLIIENTSKIENMVNLAMV